MKLAAHDQLQSQIDCVFTCTDTQGVEQSEEDTLKLATDERDYKELNEDRKLHKSVIDWQIIPEDYAKPFDFLMARKGEDPQCTVQLKTSKNGEESKVEYGRNVKFTRKFSQLTH